MNFDMIILNLNITKKQSYVTWIMIALLYILKQKVFIKILPKMLINGLIQVIMIKTIKDHYQ